MMGSVGSDELLVARQADDGGAGELLRRHGAAGGRRGVGQVPRRHGLEEPLGRRRACGRAGRRRWRPAGSSRHAQSAARTRRQDAEAGEHLKAARGRAKSKKDTVSEPGSAATTSTRRSDRSAARLLRGEECRHASSSLRTRPRDSVGNENGTAPRSAESAGRKHARTAMITTPSASFSGLAPPDVVLFVVPFLGSVQLETPVRSLT